MNVRVHNRVLIGITVSEYLMSHICCQTLRRVCEFEHSVIISNKLIDQMHFSTELTKCIFMGLWAGPSICFFARHPQARQPRIGSPLVCCCSSVKCLADDVTLQYVVLWHFNSLFILQPQSPTWMYPLALYWGLGTFLNYLGIN